MTITRVPCWIDIESDDPEAAFAAVASILKDIQAYQVLIGDPDTHSFVQYKTEE